MTKSTPPLINTALTSFYFQIAGWVSCNVHAPSTCDNCASFTTENLCNAQPGREWRSDFTYDVSKEITTLWFPEGLVHGESVFYGSFDPEGIKGDRGERGQEGQKGMQGIQGEKGERGATGARGYNGTKGESMFKGTFDSQLATVYAYEVGNIVEFQNELFHLIN